MSAESISINLLSRLETNLSNGFCQNEVYKACSFILKFENTYFELHFHTRLPETRCKSFLLNKYA
jgi:hypothetical protein